MSGPFWEDSLACPTSYRKIGDANASEFFEPEYPAGEPRLFQIGSALFQAAGVCRRCPVPERNSFTGKLSHLFRDSFEAFRLRRLLVALGHLIGLISIGWGLIRSLGVTRGWSKWVCR